MSSKSFAGYNAVARKIRQLAPQLNIEKLISDFEIALKQAFLHNFPEIEKLISCFFNLCYVSIFKKLRNFIKLLNLSKI